MSKEKNKKIDIDEAELNILADILSIHLFHEKIDIHISINNRLKTTLAWLKIPYDKSQAPCIEVSGLVMRQDLPIIVDTLCHEITHYHLFRHNMPYQDEEDEFQALLYKNGISPSKTLSTHNGIIKAHYYIYRSDCKCGFYINSFLPIGNESYGPTLLCPICGKKLKNKIISERYRKYIPTTKVKEMCEKYLDTKKNVLSG